MTFTQDIGDGYQALDLMGKYWKDDGYGVVNPTSSTKVTIGSGDLGVNDTLSVPAQDVFIDGSTVNVAQATLSLSGSDQKPRKDTVWVDSTGTPQVTEGTPASAKPGGKVREQTFNPAPPLPTEEPAVLLAEVWVGEDATSVSDADIRDRRVDASSVVQSTSTTSIVLQDTGVQ